jgi:hypothetical protein
LGKTLQFASFCQFLSIISRVENCGREAIRVVRFSLAFDKIKKGYFSTACCENNDVRLKDE